MLEGRHLQVAVDDPVLAKTLAEQGWDGGLRPPKGSDFLAVVDSNVGFNKTNAAVVEEIAYRLAPMNEGLEATLTLTYTHTAPAGAEPICDRASRYGDSYDALINRCYWDYLRVYAPGGSELLEAEGLNQPSTEQGERGTTVFSGSFSLRPGDQRVVTLRYRLPTDLPAAPYRLFVRKQAGTLAPPLTVSGPGCSWTGDLAQDRTFVCDGRGDAGTRGHGRGHGDAGTRGHGDTGTRGRGEEERGEYSELQRVAGVPSRYGCRNANFRDDQGISTRGEVFDGGPDAQVIEIGMRQYRRGVEETTLPQEFHRQAE